MDVRVLGPVEVRRDGARLAIGGPKQRGILALLVASVGRPLSLDRIMDGVYGDDSTAGARRSAQTFISAIRRELGGVVRRDGSGYSLAIDPALIDAVRFEDQVRTALPLVGAYPDRAAEALQQALTLWRGDAYADVDGMTVLVPEITRLHELRLAALEARVDADLAAGRHRELVGELEALTMEHPLRERFRGQLMLALYRNGRQADALRAFASARVHLVEELGIDPSSELRNLEQRILEHDPVLDHHSVAATGRRGNLPKRLSSFLGRSEEVAQVASLIRQHRLVTLTGLGGIGKTALAIELARRTADQFPDGVWLVKLASIADPASVVGEIADALAIPEHPTLPLLEAVADAIAPKSLLLVIDNCEHVVAEASRVLGTLLERTPAVHVLTTSREPLQSPGERTWRVPPLDTPGVGAISSVSDADGFDAVRLFVERVKEVEPRFALDRTNLEDVVAICRRLDGIPLALELAAARLRALSPHDLSIRLEDRFAVLTGGGRGRPRRHQTLLAAMDWSHDLLRSPEQATLRRLAVFHGGFGLEAAESICPGDGIEVGDVLDHLSRLLDASLLVHQMGEPGRYAMLESVQHYASLLLTGSGEDATIRRRHADHYGGLIPLEPDLDSPEFRRMLDELAREHDNFRGALAWAVAAGDGDRALTLVSGLMRHWFFSGQAEQSLHWLPRVLEIADTTPSVARTQVLHYLGVHLTAAGRRQEALAVLGEAEVAAGHLNDARATAGVVLARSRLLEAEGDLKGSRDLLLDHLTTSRRLGVPDLPLHLGIISLQSLLLGDVDLAAATTLDLEELGVAGRRPLALAWATGNRGLLAFQRGDLAEADERLREAVDRLTELSQEEMAEEVRGLAQVSLASGDIDAAELWARRLVDQGRQNLATREMVEGHTLLARIAIRRGRLPEAGRMVTRALDLAVACDEELSLTEVLLVAGQYARAAGHLEESAVLHAGAETRRARIGLVRPLPRAQELEAEVADLAGALGANAFTAARRSGAALSTPALVGRVTAMLDVSTTSI